MFQSLFRLVKSKNFIGKVPELRCNDATKLNCFGDLVVEETFKVAGMAELSFGYDMVISTAALEQNSEFCQRPNRLPGLTGEKVTGK